MNGSETRSPGWSPHLLPGVDREHPVVATTALTASWLRQWADDPARPVLHDDDRGWMAGGEVEEASRRAARRLLAAGLAPGDRVVLSAVASTDSVVAYVGALRAGLVVVPVNPAFRPPEVVHIVRDAEPRAAIVDDEERARWIEDASVGPILVTSPGGDGPGTTADLPDLGPDDPAVIVYTSGTTGKPKGVPMNHGNLWACAEAIRIAWRLTPEDRLVLSLPLFHLHGLGAGVNGLFHCGGSIALHPKFEPGAVLAGPRTDGATLFFGVPTMYVRLLEHDDVASLGQYRLCVSGSAPLAPDVFAAIEARAGVVILERYGMTETVLTISNPHDAERRPGTVGFPLPGVEVRLSAAAGEIEVRGPSVSAGYWRNAPATAEAFTRDGWFRTGDLGSVDADGYISIVGRLKELIITGGYNVYPREVEEALLEHPGISEVAVRGVCSSTWGEAVVAWVVADDGLDETAVTEFARSRLAPYKCPKAVRFVSTLPRNALGKVLKDELAE